MFVSGVFCLLCCMQVLLLRLLLGCHCWEALHMPPTGLLQHHLVSMCAAEPCWYQFLFAIGWSCFCGGRGGVLASAWATQHLNTGEEAERRPHKALA
jgi:hypothetical protein